MLEREHGETLLVSAKVLPLSRERRITNPVRSGPSPDVGTTSVPLGGGMRLFGGP
jgi:hypothetical protein